MPATNNQEQRTRNRSAALASMHLLAAYAHLREVGDPLLCGYAIALVRRVSNPVTPDAAPATDSAARWSVRAAIQRRGITRCVELLDAWADDPADDRPFTDICREIYLIGIDAGIDSVMPEIADIALTESPA